MQRYLVSLLCVCRSPPLLCLSPVPLLPASRSRESSATEATDLKTKSWHRLPIAGAHCVSLLAASESVLCLVGRVPVYVSLAAAVVVLIGLFRVSIHHIGEDYDRGVV